MVQSMMSYSTLLVAFWGYALQSAFYILNSVPSKSVPKTPHELWMGRKTTLNLIRVWDCPAHILDKESNKLDSYSDVCIFVGYPRGKKGGYFYNPKEGNVLISKNATFLEASYIQDFKSQSKVMLKDMSNNIVSLVIPNEENVPINK